MGYLVWHNTSEPLPFRRYSVLPYENPQRTLNSQGGAIWCMAANSAGTQLALGCEDGRVRLIDVSNGEMSHLRRFDRAKCRILSIAWGPPVPRTSSSSRNKREGDETSDEDEDEEWSDSWLVTGGSDSSLRKWDVGTGRILDRMSTDKARGERTLVWTVGVLAYVPSTMCHFCCLTSLVETGPLFQVIL